MRGAGFRPLSRRAGALLALLLVPLLGGCIDEARERELGDQIAAQVNATTPLVRDPALNRYVTRLGTLLAQQGARPDLPYHFYIVNSAEVNAFALPGGHIYVNRGLLERTENVAELSAVLAHEIGHVAARHGAEMLERRLRTGSVVSMLYNLILGAEPSLLDQSALQMGRQLWVASHSREAELEADRLAVRYLVGAGVEPEGILTLLGGLLKEEARTDRPTLEWLSTHPTTQRRIDLAKRQIERRRPENGRALARDVASFRLFQKRLEMLPPPVHPIIAP